MAQARGGDVVATLAGSLTGGIAAGVVAALAALAASPKTVGAERAVAVGLRTGLIVAAIVAVRRFNR